MITSTQNPRIKELHSLSKPRERRKKERFLIEGEKELTRAAENGICICTLVYCLELLGDNEQLVDDSSLESFLSSRSEGAERLEVSSSVFDRLAYRQGRGGLIAEAVIPESRRLENIDLSNKPFLLAIAGIEKPGNLGALLRTADAAGVDAVILCDPQLDLFNPNVVRASIGAIFTVPTVQAGLEETLAWLRKKNIQIVITSPQANLPYTKIDYTPPTAILLGSEAEGLPETVLHKKDGREILVTIPQYGQMDSLNLACSGAILMYEVVRQRKSR